MWHKMVTRTRAELARSGQNSLSLFMIGASGRAGWSRAGSLRQYPIPPLPKDRPFTKLRNRYGKHS